ncbi:adenylate/guanylate cyclase domain-containing protein [Rhodovibrionaceae bacterium A322]
MDELTDWLETIGLAQYARVFEENGVDRATLVYLSEEDLIGLGLLLGHRRRLQAALAEDFAKLPQAQARLFSQNHKPETDGESPGTASSAPQPRQSSDTPRPADVSPAAEAERRLLTVLFCDLMDSTRLSTELELEDYRDLIAAYQEACSQVLTRYDGYVAKFMGDGVLAYFGYPQAHEDDAQRAVRAALDLVKVVPALQCLPDLTPAVRVGIATGKVVVGDVVGDGSAEERAVLGVTPNLAARLQGVAGENQIVVSEGTSHRLLQAFDMEALGEVSLKGIADPTKAWRVDGLAKESGGMISSSPFVGRSATLTLLAEAWMGSRSGQGLQVFHLTGPAGVGKTRLVQEFLARQSPEQLEVWTCSDFQGNRPFHPLPKDQLAETVSHETDSGEAQRQALFDGIVTRLQQRLQAGPLVLFVEDVHWIDPTTADLLQRLRQKLSSAPLLILLASRPDEAADDLAKGLGGSRLQLGVLDAVSSASLVHSLAGDQLSAAARKQIVERAGGLPLFLEELTDVVSRGDSDSVPASLQESLLARLDSVGAAKRVAQLASVFGRSFKLDDLAALPEVQAESLNSALDQLLTGGLLRQEPAGLVFRHALLRDVAYETLLRSTRRRVHGEIADRLMTGLESPQDFPEPDVVARHLSGAGRVAEAAPFWLEAARRSAALWAHSEAAGYFLRGLEGAEALADDRWELQARLDLVQSLRLLERPQEALGQLDLAQDLAERVGQDSDWLQLHVLRGNILFPLGDSDGCLASQEAALKVARRMGDPEAEARALSSVADAQFARSRLVSAERAYAACVVLARKEGLTAVESANLSLLGHMRLYHCQLQEARLDCEKAVQMAEAAGNRRAELTARGSCLGKVLLESGELEAADLAFRQSVALAEELEALRFVALNLIFQGSVALERGAKLEALQLAEKAVDLARPTAPRFCLPMALGIVARASDDPLVCRAVMTEAEELIMTGSLAHNPLWFFRDAILASAARGWSEETRHYAQALRQAFKEEPLPWSDLVAESGEALALWLESNDSQAVQMACQKAGDLGFVTWKNNLEEVLLQPLGSG